MARIRLRTAPAPALRLSTEPAPVLRLHCGYAGGGGGMPDYTGPYEVVPGEEAQTLPTRGKGMTADVVVARIPANYGRIEWNGSTLRLY